MGFMDAYKRLEKLCGKIKQADKKPRSARRVLLWIFLILALHEAERIIYDAGINAAEPMFGIPSKKQKTHYTT